MPRRGCREHFVVAARWVGQRRRKQCGWRTNLAPSVITLLRKTKKRRKEDEEVQQTPPHNARMSWLAFFCIVGCILCAVCASSPSTEPGEWAKVSEYSPTQLFNSMQKKPATKDITKSFFEKGWTKLKSIGNPERKAGDGQKRSKGLG